MNILDIRNCIWANQEKTSIDCEIKAEEFPNYIPYTASKNDTWPEGIAIYEKIITEKYEIKDYITPVAIPKIQEKKIPTVDELEQQLKLISSQLEELKKSK